MRIARTFAVLLVGISALAVPSSFFATASDDFDRAFSSDLGANWSHTEGNIGTTGSGIAVGSATAQSRAYYSAIAWDDDQTSQWVAVNGTLGVTVRHVSNTWYQCFGTVTGGGALWKSVSGSVTEIGTFADTIDSIETLKASAIGPTISCLLNDVEVVDVTDAVIAGGGSPGVMMGNDGSQADGWFGASSPSVGGSPPRGGLLLRGIGGQ